MFRQILFLTFIAIAFGQQHPPPPPPPPPRHHVLYPPYPPPPPPPPPPKYPPRTQPYYPPPRPPPPPPPPYPREENEKECGGVYNEYGNCSEGLECKYEIYSYKGICVNPCEDLNCKGNCQCCKYGSYPEKCSCCERCFSGCGETCGGAVGKHGKCAPGLICAKENTGREACIRNCTIPVGTDGLPCPKCSSETSPNPDPCSCCDICHSKCNDICGGKDDEFGTCSRGFVCNVLFTPLNIGYCTRMCDPEDSAFVKEDCPFCPFGDFPNEDGCSCCSNCYKGCGESCGLHDDRYGICVEQFSCLPSDMHEGGGICKRTCNPSRCPFCQHGSFPDPTDECNCCPICFKGCNEPCGGRDLETKRCKQGLVCEQSEMSMHGEGKCKEPCIKEKCPHCMFGSFPDPNSCNCCKTCKKGCNEECGGENDEFGVCANDFFCDTFGSANGKGICKRNCAAFLCLRCKHGDFPNPDDECSCCRICYKGCDETCGGKRGEHGVCKPQTMCETSSGKNGKGVCKKLSSCAAEVCPECPFKSYKDPKDCSCCNRCYKGCGEPCGGMDDELGKCAPGFMCDTSGAKDGEGICIKNCADSSCDKCSEVKCKTEAYASKCSCCPRCFVGHGKRCGAREDDEKCAPGLTCNAPPNSNGQGNCKAECPEPECVGVDCPDCDFGSFPNPCGCCKICRKGPNQECGGEDNEYGYCSEGLQCVEKGGEDGIGRCRSECTPDDCPNGHGHCPKCKHKSFTDPCDCCPSCFKGCDESCGSENEGTCAPGLRCHYPPNGNGHGKCK